MLLVCPNACCTWRRAPRPTDQRIGRGIRAHLFALFRPDLSIAGADSGRRVAHTVSSESAHNDGLALRARRSAEARDCLDLWAADGQRWRRWRKRPFRDLFAPGCADRCAPPFGQILGGGVCLKIFMRAARARSSGRARRPAPRAHLPAPRDGGLLLRRNRNGR